MRNSRYLIVAALVGLAVAGPACTQKAADETTKTSDAAFDKTKAATNTALDAAKEGAVTTIDETRKAGEETSEASRNLAERTIDKTKEIADKTATETKEIAGDVAAKTKEITATTGKVITDGWITAKISTKFVDETLLKGSNINVDTDDRVVTLKGVVASSAAKNRAEAIAHGTEGVTRVVNQIVVK